MHCGCEPIRRCSGELYRVGGVVRCVCVQGVAFGIRRLMPVYSQAHACILRGPWPPTDRPRVLVNEYGSDCQLATPLAMYAPIGHGGVWHMTMTVALPFISWWCEHILSGPWPPTDRPRMLVNEYLGTRLINRAKTRAHVIKRIRGPSLGSCVRSICTIRVRLHLVRLLIARSARACTLAI